MNSTKIDPEVEVELQHGDILAFGFDIPNQEDRFIYRVIKITMDFDTSVIDNTPDSFSTLSSCGFVDCVVSVMNFIVYSLRSTKSDPFLNMGMGSYVFL